MLAGVDETEIGRGKGGTDGEEGGEMVYREVRGDGDGERCREMC